MFDCTIKQPGSFLHKKFAERILMLLDCWLYFNLITELTLCFIIHYIALPSCLCIPDYPSNFVNFLPLGSVISGLFGECNFYASRGWMSWKLFLMWLFWQISLSCHIRCKTILIESSFLLHERRECLHCKQLCGIQFSIQVYRSVTWCVKYL